MTLLLLWSISIPISCQSAVFCLCLCFDFFLFSRHTHTAQNYEIIGSFFQSYNFEPKWVPSNAWGHVDPASGKWIGAIAEVGRDQAEVAMGNVMGCSAPRLTQAGCLPSTGKETKGCDEH